MIVTKDNVKVGDKLFIYPTDTRFSRPHTFEVCKIGNKFISNQYGDKIQIGAQEIFRKDGIGSPEYVFKDEDEMNETKRLSKIKSEFCKELEGGKYRNRIFNMDEDAIEGIKKILERYSNDWSIRI